MQIELLIFSALISLPIMIVVVAFAWEMIKRQDQILFQQYKILALLKPAGRAARIEFFAFIDGKKIRIRDMKQIRVDQTIQCSVEFTDKKGNPAKVDGVPKWGVSDEKLASLAVADDGMSCVVTPLGEAGSVKLLLNADADLGEGVKEITGESEEIVIVGLEASQVALKLGEPVDQPEALAKKKK